MASRRKIEIERKFDANDSTPLPPLHLLPGVVRVDPPAEIELDAVYFDTAELDLTARRLTLRRRTGGDDAGWHLKLPVSDEEREEVHAPLGSEDGVVPAPLLTLVRALVRDRDLAPVVRLRNRRVVHRLVGENNEVLAELADDHVHAELLTPAALSGAELTPLSWREWEVELVTGERPLLEAVEELFAGTGVERSDSPSKLVRALGPAAPIWRPANPPRPRAKSSAATVVLAAVADQLKALLNEDPRVRTDAPHAIHRMRIATRRLRSTLSTYRSLVDADAGARLRGDLKWLAGVLGEARDEEVLRDRLLSRLREEPAGLVLGPVRERLGARFTTDLGAAHERTRAALDSTRYFRLLDALEAFLLTPPLTAAALRPARKTVRKLLRTDAKRLHRAVRDLSRTEGKHTESHTAHDQALHLVRKRAKALRYAAESAAQVDRGPARRLARAAQNLQSILGEHQDSVVARETLLRLGAVDAFLNGENAFSYGRLHALEEARASAAEARFRRAWAHFPPVD